jgi:hypothetical protein
MAVQIADTSAPFWGIHGSRVLFQHALLDLAKILLSPAERLCKSAIGRETTLASMRSSRLSKKEFFTEGSQPSV